VDSVVNVLESLQESEALNRLLLRLPQRHPDLLVDKITYLEKNKFIASIKNITRSEIPLAGVNANRYYPSTMILESLVQTCFILIMHDQLDIPDAEGQNLLSGLSDAKFHQAVVAGDQLLLTAEVIEKKPYIWTLESRAATEENLVAEATINFKSAA